MGPRTETGEKLRKFPDGIEPNHKGIQRMHWGIKAMIEKMRLLALKEGYLLNGAKLATRLGGSGFTIVPVGKVQSCLMAVFMNSSSRT